MEFVNAPGAAAAPKVPSFGEGLSELANLMAENFALASLARDLADRMVGGRPTSTAEADKAPMPNGHVGMLYSCVSGFKASQTQIREELNRISSAL